MTPSSGEIFARCKEYARHCWPRLVFHDFIRPWTDESDELEYFLDFDADGLSADDGQRIERDLYDLAWRLAGTFPIPVGFGHDPGLARKQKPPPCPQAPRAVGAGEPEHTKHHA